MMTRDESDQPHAARSVQISLLSLPDELLHLVLSHIYGPEPVQLRSLNATALVCTRLRAVARPFLFHRVRLDFFVYGPEYDEFVLAFGSEDDSEDWRVVADPWSEKLIDKLRDLDYARHIHELKLTIQTFDIFDLWKPAPAFATFGRWFPDRYDELWKKLKREHLGQLDIMAEKLRDLSMYPTEASFRDDLQNLHTGTNRFKEVMARAWVRYFIRHDLNKANERGSWFPIRHLSLNNFPALRLIDLDKEFSDFSDFLSHCRDWPAWSRPNELTIRALLRFNRLDAEDALSFRRWARAYKVRLVIKPTPNSAGSLLDTGPYEGGNSSDNAADPGILEENEELYGGGNVEDEVSLE